MASTLSGIEEAYDDPEEFRNFCHRFQEERPEFANTPFFQWYLHSIAESGLEIADLKMEITNLDELKSEIQNPKSDFRNSQWTWNDPFGDCSFSVGEGLEIHAANGRDLWHLNLSAPRVLRSVSGDFAVQTVCVPVDPFSKLSEREPLSLNQGVEKSPPSHLEPALSVTKGKGAWGLGQDKPTIGGLLFWKDKENYLRLDRGIRSKYEISLEGCLENKDVIIGRGRLPSGRVYLRFERNGGLVNALCSSDGDDWFTVGQVEFPVDDPVEVGLHAIGLIDRNIYHGGFPEGTAIRFESLKLWEK